jgi:Ca2+-binding EF-hand superfamily protein
MSPWTKLATLWFVTATLLAQTSRGTATAEDTSPPGTAVETYTESKSRSLFTSCDANSDDRLDFFEACAAFDWLHGKKDHAGFARLDQDRDGYVGWPEFDRQFQATVKRGATFRVDPCRRLVEQAPEQQKASPPTPVQVFLQLLDANRNGGLDPAEIDQFARVGLTSPQAIQQLRSLDLDRTGRIEEPELAPWFKLHKIQALVPPMFLTAGPSSVIGDENGDGTLDESELTRMLQRLDPSLGRWAATLMQRLDRNQDKRLDPQELSSPEVGTAQATTPAQLPKEAPVR